MANSGGGINLGKFKAAKNLWNGELIGKVTDNKDMPKGLPGYVPPTSDGAPVHNDGKRPTLGLGRLKIEIPGLTDEIPDLDKTWYNVKSRLGTGNGAGVGGFVIPAVGSFVTLEKVGLGEYDYIVTGEYNSTQQQTADYNENYPETWGARDKTGTKSVINMKTHRAFFQHVSKTSAEIIKSGTTNIEIKDDLNVHVNDNTTDEYDGWHDETIGEYRMTDIGQYVDETVGTYFDGLYGTTYTETVGGLFTGTYNSGFTEMVTGNYAGQVTGMSTYNVTGAMSMIAEGVVNVMGGPFINVLSAGAINNVASTIINMTTPLVKINGNLFVTGYIVALGPISVPGTSLGTHVHPGVKPGPAFTLPGRG